MDKEKQMTIREYIDDYFPFYFVHIDYDNEMHEEIKKHTEDYEIISIKKIMHLFVVEVRN